MCSTMCHLPAKMTDEELDMLFTDLEKKRTEWTIAETSKGMTHVFKFFFCNSKWGAKGDGCPWEAAKGETKATDGLDWCNTYGMASSASFDSDLYGEEKATVFAQSWCSRQNYLDPLWLDQADAKYIYTKADLSGWRRPQAFTAAMSTASKRQVRYIGDRFARAPKLRGLQFV